MTGLVAVTVLSGVALLAAGFCLPIVAATVRPDSELRRAVVRQWDLPGWRSTRRRGPSLTELASERARESYLMADPSARPGADCDPRTAHSARFRFGRGSAVITSSVSGHASPTTARAMAQAPLQPGYTARYRAELAAEARGRGLEVRDCWTVVEPSRPGAPSAVTAVVTTWLEVGLPGGAHSTHLSATEIILVGGDMCPTVTATGVDVLSQGAVLRKIAAKLSSRLPASTGTTSPAVPADWLFWPHGA